MSRTFLVRAENDSELKGILVYDPVFGWRHETDSERNARLSKKTEQEDGE